MKRVEFEDNISNLKVCGCTDKGMVRPHNEDFYGYFVPEDEAMREKWGSLFVISDGVGGNQAGEVASAEAVNVLLQEYYFGIHPEKISDRLKSSLDKVTIHVYDLSVSNPICSNMMCTLTALNIRGDRFQIAHIGDSKALLLRSGKLIQLTKDHSLVGKLLRLGLLSEEAARTHPNKNILLRALGGNPIQQFDFYSGHIFPGDLFCLVTDGILEHLTFEELKEYLSEMDSGKRDLQSFMEEANRRGGYDNMTVVALRATCEKFAR